MSRCVCTCALAGCPGCITVDDSVEGAVALDVALSLTQGNVVECRADGLYAPAPDPDCCLIWCGCENLEPSVIIDGPNIVRTLVVPPISVNRALRLTITAMYPITWQPTLAGNVVDLVFGIDSIERPGDCDPVEGPFDTWQAICPLGQQLANCGPLPRLRTVRGAPNPGAEADTVVAVTTVDLPGAGLWNITPFVRSMPEHTAFVGVVAVTVAISSAEIPAGSPACYICGPA